MKEIFIDVETTGLDPIKHQIFQLAGDIYINGEKKEFFDIKMKPMEGKSFNPDALKVCNVTPEQIRSYEDTRISYKNFIKILSKYVDRYNKKDKFFFYAYMPNWFDANMLRQLFVECGDKYLDSWFYSTFIDVASIASEALKPIRTEMANFKLGTVAHRLGIEHDPKKLHDASEDVRITREVYLVCTGILSGKYKIKDVRGFEKL